MFLDLPSGEIGTQDEAQKALMEQGDDDITSVRQIMEDLSVSSWEEVQEWYRRHSNQNGKETPLSEEEAMSILAKIRDRGHVGNRWNAEILQNNPEALSAIAALCDGYITQTKVACIPGGPSWTLIQKVFGDNPNWQRAGGDKQPSAVRSKEGQNKQLLEKQRQEMPAKTKANLASGQTSTSVPATAPSVQSKDKEAQQISQSQDTVTVVVKAPRNVLTRMGEIHISFGPQES